MNDSSKDVTCTPRAYLVQTQHASGESQQEMLCIFNWFILISKKICVMWSQDSGGSQAASGGVMSAVWMDAHNWE